MDLIASIKFIESRLGGYHSSPGKSKPKPKNILRHAVYENNAQTDENYSSSDENKQLGRNIDVTV